MRLRNPFFGAFEASKLVSTKTLLLKHHDRRQGSAEHCMSKLEQLEGTHMKILAFEAKGPESNSSAGSQG